MQDNMRIRIHELYEKIQKDLNKDLSNFLKIPMQENRFTAHNQGLLNKNQSTAS